MIWILWMIPENTLSIKSYSDGLKSLKPSIPCESWSNRTKPKVVKRS